MKKSQEIQNKPILNTLKNISPKKIIAVTKKKPIEAVCLALKNNITKIGENQVQEAQKKFKNFKDRDKIELHFIGKLQSNKINKAVEIFDVIQTVESKKQIKKIAKKAKELNKNQKIYIQINISEDPKKSGARKEEIEALCKIVEEEKNIVLCGIMTILKKDLKKDSIYLNYKKTKKIQENIFKNNKKCKEVSMGMSGDYQIAIKAGATQVRLGTTLFGKRKWKYIYLKTTKNTLG